MGSGERTHAHPDQGLRGAVDGYYGHRRLHAGAFAPDDRKRSLISMFLCFPDTSSIGSLGAENGPAADPGGGLPVIDSGYCAVQVDLTPMGAGRLLGISPTRLDEGHHDVSAVLGAGAFGLMRQLTSTTSWHVRFGAVDRYLLAQLESARPRSLAVGAAWRNFAESPGTIVIGELAWVPGKAGTSDLSTVASTNLGDPLGPITPKAAMSHTTQPRLFEVQEVERIVRVVEQLSTPEV